jgi:hypothetical protein
MTKHELEGKVRGAVLLYTEAGPKAGFAIAQILAAAQEYADTRVADEKEASLSPEMGRAPEGEYGRMDTAPLEAARAQNAIAKNLLRDIRGDMAAARALLRDTRERFEAETMEGI